MYPLAVDTAVATAALASAAAEFTSDAVGAGLGMLAGHVGLGRLVGSEVALDTADGLLELEPRLQAEPPSCRAHLLLGVVFGRLPAPVTVSGGGASILRRPHERSQR